MSDEKTPRMVFNNDAVYDTLKYVAQIVLPGFIVLYISLAQLWGFPNPELIVGTVAAFNTFLGALLGISAKVYNAYSEEQNAPNYQGTLNVIETEEKKLIDIAFDGDPHTLDEYAEVTFRINTDPDMV